MDYFRIDGMSLEMDPAISKWGFEDLGDDPDKHRWRAFWVDGHHGGDVTGVCLCAYPVIKINPKSVWINADGYREATKQPWEDGAPAKEWGAFVETWMKKKLCYNGSGASWAKTTQDEAIRSLAIRLTRWSSRISNEAHRAKSAADALEKLRPDLSSYAITARENLQ